MFKCSDAGESGTSDVVNFSVPMRCLVFTRYKTNASTSASTRKGIKVISLLVLALVLVYSCAESVFTVKLELFMFLAFVLVFASLVKTRLLKFNTFIY